jgi:tetratricopeptide (TPR) repeat protein
MSGDVYIQPKYDKRVVYGDVRPAPVDAATVAEAQARLAELPVTEIPDPAPLPGGSRITAGRNDLFVGREADLVALATALKGGETAAIGQIAAATGLGGIGKTQLANEFAHRYGQFFAGGVFWLSFADPNAIAAEVAACGGVGALELRPDFGNLSQDDQLRAVLAAWQGPLPRLLVFDNCEDEAALARWRPPAGGARVLVTSRRAEWGRELGVSALPLGVLVRDESVAFLQKHRPELPEDDPELAAIADELGDLPLALHLAGSFLERYRHADFGVPAAYLTDLRRPDLLAHRSLTGGGASPTGHEQHVARSFALSHDRLDPGDPTDALALDVLARAACFAPGEPIPRALLSASLAPAADDAEAALRFEDAVARCTALGLLDQRDGGHLVLHRLLGLFVRRETAHLDPARTAVEVAIDAEAYRLNQAGYPAPLAAWLPHLRAVADEAAARGSERAGTLHNSLGYHLRIVADFAGARAAYERALAIDEAAFGPDHPNVATDVNNLGGVLRDLGKLAGALAAYERALAIDEAAFGPDHRNVARDVNNLGRVLNDLGDLAGARAAYERALAIDEAAFGPDHPKVAIRVNNLGGVLRDLGDLVGARAACERALGIFERVLGPEHPNVATFVNNLGLVLRALGDLAGARAAFERALAIFERVLGPEHPHTRTVRGNLAALDGAGR